MFYADSSILNTSPVDNRDIMIVSNYMLKVILANSDDNLIISFLERFVAYCSYYMYLCWGSYDIMSMSGCSFLTTGCTRILKSLYSNSLETRA
jgi:hypothetical protein